MLYLEILSFNVESDADIHAFVVEFNETHVFPSLYIMKIDGGAVV